jgi:ERCC4-type nuclease
LQTSDSHADIVDEDSYFYGDLLDRRTAEILRELDSLSTEKQEAVCRLAGKDDLSMDSPKEERVSKQLKAIGGESATRCLQEIEKTENWWHKKK